MCEVSGSACQWQMYGPCCTLCMKGGVRLCACATTTLYIDRFIFYLLSSIYCPSWHSTHGLRTFSRIKTARKYIPSRYHFFLRILFFRMWWSVWRKSKTFDRKDSSSNFKWEGIGKIWSLYICCTVVWISKSPPDGAWVEEYIPNRQTIGAPYSSFGTLFNNDNTVLGIWSGYRSLLKAPISWEEVGVTSQKSAGTFLNWILAQYALQGWNVSSVCFACSCKWMMKWLWY